MIQTRKTKSTGSPVRQKVRTPYFIRTIKKENLAEAYFQHIRCNMFYIRQILSIMVNQVPTSDHYVLMMRTCKILMRIRQTITDSYWMEDDANQTIADLNQTLSIINAKLFPKSDGKEKEHLLN